ncbi:MAG TPA: GNAT family N-acetyltransferase [Casimicrobiaceae bacterium]|nr:GNAT family N-acetyltransferase [Casimicrobiaceae bacterium]
MTNVGTDAATPTPWRLTERIALRELTRSDGAQLHRLDRDPTVMRYIRDGRTASRAEVEERMRRSIAAYRLYPGLGRWYAQRRDTGGFIGWFVLNYIPRTVEVEVGYRLLPEAWGQGYATEGATDLVRYGFHDLGLRRIIGITHPDNLASQRVLQKAGLHDRGWGRYYDHDVRLFVAER